MRGLRHAPTTVLAALAAVTTQVSASDGEQFMPAPIQWCFIVFLILLGGVFSGLSLGLMQMDPNRLKIVSKSGTPIQKKWAKAIYPWRKNGNYLLSVLLIGNVLTNNTVAILLEQLTDGLTSIVASTASITVFGEIIPQALCGRNPLWTGYWTLPITIAFYFILSPGAYPVSLLLNWLLGEEVGVFYLREELAELLRLTQKHSDIDRDEMGILTGALSLKSTILEEVMCPINDVFMVEANIELTKEVLLKLSEDQFSRLPVYNEDRDNVVGLLLSHDLIAVAASLDEGGPVKTVREVMFACTPRRMPATAPLQAALNEFRGSECHVVFACDKKNRLVGMVTKNVVVEAVLQTRFPDERIAKREGLSSSRNSPNLEAMIANGAYMPNGAHGGYVPYIDGDINLGESTMQEDSVNTPLLAQQPVSYGGGDQPGNDNLDSDL